VARPRRATLGAHPPAVRGPGRALHGRENRCFFMACAVGCYCAVPAGVRPLRRDPGFRTSGRSVSPSRTDHGAGDWSPWPALPSKPSSGQAIAALRPWSCGPQAGSTQAMEVAECGDHEDDLMRYRTMPISRRTFTCCCRTHPGAWHSGHFPGAHGWWAAPDVRKPCLPTCGTKSGDSCTQAENSPRSTH